MSHENMDNQNGDDIYDKVKNGGGRAVSKGTKAMGRKANKAVGKGVKGLAKAGGKVAKAGGKALFGALKSLFSMIASAIVVILPYLLIILVVILIFMFFFHVTIDNRGKDGRFSLFSWNVEKVDDGYYTADNLNSENRAVAQFYKYFSENSYYQMKVNSDGSAIDTEYRLPSLEEGEIIRDFYEREKLFYIPSELLFMIDDVMYRGNVRYPEQITQPIKYDGDYQGSDLSYVDESGNRVLSSDTLSEDFDRETGKDSIGDVGGVWDYGLAPIYKYFKAEKWEKIEGEIVDKQIILNKDADPSEWYTVWLSEYEGSYEPEKFNVMAVRGEINDDGDYVFTDIREDIHLMYSASTFAGNFTWKYNFKPEEIGEKRLPLIANEPNIEDMNVLGLPYEYVIYEEVEVIYWEDVIGLSFIIGSGSYGDIDSLNSKGKLSDVYIASEDKYVYYKGSSSKWKKIRYSNLNSVVKGFEAETSVDIDGNIIVKKESVSYSRIGSFTDLRGSQFKNDVVKHMKGNTSNYRNISVSRLSANGKVYYSYEKEVIAPPILLKIKRDGYVVEYAPRVSSEEKDIKGKTYFYDYFNNFASWIPKTYSIETDGISEQFDFENRFNQIVSVGLNIGSNANIFSSYYKDAKKYSSQIEQISDNSVDNSLIQAIVAYELKKNKQDYDKKLSSDEIIEIIRDSSSGMKKMLEQFENDTLVALCAYNWGYEAMNTFQSMDEFSGYFGEGIINWVDYRGEFEEEYFISSVDIPKNYNVSYVEDVMSYYEGNVGYDQLLNHDKETVWEKIWSNSVGVVVNTFTTVVNAIRVEVTPHGEKMFLKNNLSDIEINQMILMSLSFKSGNTMSYSDFREEDIPYFNMKYISTGVISQMTLAETRATIPMIDDYVSPLGDGIPIYTSPFGMRIHPVKKVLKLHTGIDVAVPTNTNLYSIDSGVVIFAGVNGGYGTQIQILLDDGRTIAYAHLNGFPDYIRVGVVVQKGELVAYSGNSGTSTGAHLHFEYKLPDGSFVDPFYILDLHKPGGMSDPDA